MNCTVKTNIITERKKDIFCMKCQGSCLDKTNNARTQELAKKKFGIIPNNCVSENNGRLKCPYAN